MPRKKRVWFPGATYHIVCRGNHQHNIFHDDEDRECYIVFLKRAKVLYPFLLHTYCLMDNHVHLHVETINVDITKIMYHINKAYAIYFNKLHRFVGHLFQGRFRWELIETDAYCLEVSRYIHLNPVNAKMVKRPIDYPWSSYSTYICGDTHNDELVETSKILGYFSDPKQQRYQEFVEDGLP